MESNSNLNHSINNDFSLSTDLFDEEIVLPNFYDYEEKLENIRENIRQYKAEESETLKKNNKEIRCTICTFTSTSLIQFKEHIVKHRNTYVKLFNYNYKSQLYRKTLPVNKSINVNNITEFKCKLCDYSTNNQKELNDHVDQHNANGKIKCLICDFTSTTFSSFKSHTAIHRKDKPFKCTTCPLSFARKCSLNNHIRKIHVENNKIRKKKVIDSSVNERQYKCGICKNFTTTDKIDYDNHKLSHEPNDIFKCSKCEYTNSKLNKVKDHEETHNKRKRYACPYCPFEGTHSGKYREHIVGHKVRKKYICDSCSYSVDKPFHLEMHKRLHSEESIYQCTECPYRCLWYNNFVVHCNKHNKSKSINNSTNGSNTETIGTTTQKDLPKTDSDAECHFSQSTASDLINLINETVQDFVVHEF